MGAFDFCFLWYAAAGESIKKPLHTGAEADFEFRLSDYLASGI